MERNDAKRQLAEKKKKSNIKEVLSFHLETLDTMCVVKAKGSRERCKGERVFVEQTLAGGATSKLLPFALRAGIEQTKIELRHFSVQYSVTGLNT